MKNILTIMKKEFARFFKDKRMVFAVLILPGLLIFLVYSFLGTNITKQLGEDTTKTATVYLVEPVPVGIEDGLNNLPNMEIKKASENDKIDDLLDKIKNKKIDIVMQFTTASDNKPDISIYYNSSNTTSMNAYTTINAMLEAMQHVELFHVNANSNTIYDVVDQKEAFGSIFGMFLPFLIITLMFSSCMSIAPESIAGEKDRGTIATLLVTPIKRSELAIGKVLSLSVLAMLCALSSFIGTVLSLPRLINQEIVDSSMKFEFSYQLTDYLLLLLIIVSTLLVLIGLISVISSYAKSVKEATTLIAPLMILTMVIGILSMFNTNSGSKNIGLYFIPIFNSLLAMGDIFAFNIALGPMLITIFSNLVYASLIIYLVTIMFKSEKVMFGR